MACIVSFDLSFHECFLHKESKPVVIKYGIVFPKCAFPFYMIMQNLTEFTAESTVCLLVPFWSLALLGNNYSFVAIIDYKVNRCLARYSQRAITTNRPTNRALNKPAWPGPN